MSIWSSDLTIIRKYTVKFSVIMITNTIESSNSRHVEGRSIKIHAHDIEILKLGMSFLQESLEIDFLCGL